MDFFPFFYLAFKWQPERHLAWAMSVLCLSIWDPDWTSGPARWSAISLNTEPGSVNLQTCYLASLPFPLLPLPRRLNWIQQMSKYIGLSWSNLPFSPLLFSLLSACWRFTSGEWSDNNRQAEARAVRVKRVLGCNGGAVCSPGPAGSGVHWDSIRGCGERFHCSLSFGLPDTHTGITVNWLCHSRQFLRCEVN